MSIKHTYSQVLKIAWPLILANSAVPLLGLVDTAVIGHTGRTVDLGAIALGALIINFVYWSFGFLRMGTTGFIARADGAGDETEIRTTLGRALLISCSLGVILIVLQWPVVALALKLLGASEDVESVTRSYFLIRIWGAPASLALFALMGVLVGLGQSGKLLKVQLLLNGINIILDIWFAGFLRWGVPGIALGTILAEWISLGFAAYLTYQLLHRRKQQIESFWSWSRLLDKNKLKQMLNANADIMVRTLLLLFSFAWFTDQAARFGDVTLAGNYILLQLVSFSAFFLDGFAFATESLVGRAAGAGKRTEFDHSVLKATVLAAGAAMLLCATILIFGKGIISGLTDIVEVQQSADRYLPFAAIYVLISFAAFQLDGIFIGTSHTRDMRNAAIVSTLLFVSSCWLLTTWWENDGLWIAFILYLIVRAITLARRYPDLRKTI